MSILSKPKPPKQFVHIEVEVLEDIKAEFVRGLEVLEREGGMRAGSSRIEMWKQYIREIDLALAGV